MADFFAPMSDIQSDVMRPIDPLLLTEDGYQRGGYEVGLGSFDIGMDREGQGLGAAPVDPMVPGDIFTPVADIYGGGGHQFASPALNGMSLGGISDVLDVFSVVRFLTEGR